MSATAASDGSQAGLFKQLQGLACTLTKETKRLNTQILKPPGQQPQMYDAAASKLTQDVSVMQKELEDLQEKCRSFASFDCFMKEAEDLLQQKLHHADRIEAYLKQYGYVAPGHKTPHAANTPSAAAWEADEAPTAEATKVQESSSILWELSPVLSSDQAFAAGVARLRPLHGRPAGQHNTDGVCGEYCSDAEKERAAAAASTAEGGARSLALSSSRPAARGASVALFKIPTVIVKPASNESPMMANHSLLEEGLTKVEKDQAIGFNPGCDSDMQYPDTLRSEIKCASSSLQGAAPAVPDHQSRSIATMRQTLEQQRRRFPGIAGAARAAPLMSAYQSIDAQQQCCVTPNTKKNVESWLSNNASSLQCSPSPLQLRMRSRPITTNPLLQNCPGLQTSSRTPNTKMNVESWLSNNASGLQCSPSPLQLRMRSRPITNPLLQNCPDLQTSSRTPRRPMRQMVASASPDLSCGSNHYRGMAVAAPMSHSSLAATAGPVTWLQASHEKKQLGTCTKEALKSTDQDRFTEDTQNDRNIQTITDAANEKETCLNLDVSLEEPVLFESTMNLIAEMKKAQENKILKENKVSSVELPAVTSNIFVQSIVAPSNPPTLHDADQPIDYSCKVRAGSDPKLEVTTDSQYLGNISNAKSYLEPASTFQPADVDTPEEPVLSYRCPNKNGPEAKIDTPEEPVLSFNYRKMKTDVGSSLIDSRAFTPEEPELSHNKPEKGIPSLDTPEEPIMCSQFSENAEVSAHIASLPKPEIKFNPQVRNYLFPSVIDRCSEVTQGHQSLHVGNSKEDEDIDTFKNNVQVHSTTPMDDLEKSPEMSDATMQVMLNFRQQKKTQTETIKQRSPMQSILHPQENIPQHSLDDSLDKSPEMSLSPMKHYYKNKVMDTANMNRNLSQKENIAPLNHSVRKSHSDHEVNHSHHLSLHKALKHSHSVDNTYADEVEDEQGHAGFRKPKPSNSRIKPPFDADMSSSESDLSQLDVSKLKISSANNSRRSACDNSFSLAMMQYSHVPASPMPPPATPHYYSKPF